MAPDVVLLTTSEVAALLRLDESTIRRWASNGKLTPVVLPGGLLRFRREDIESLLIRPEPVNAAETAGP
jgi:excisionase family DNA binding protein